MKLLMVGRFEERKGHDVLFRALRLLGERGRHLDVWVVGHPGSVDVRQLARDLSVEEMVQVLGEVSEDGLQVLYRECDIFCLPSRTDRQGCSEGLPVSLIEAMANGKPVIASRLAGIPELVEEVLVEEGSAEQLAGAIRRLCDDATLRRRLGSRNREIINSGYSEHNTMKLRDLFVKTRHSFPGGDSAVS